MLTLTALKYFTTNHGNQRVFSICNHQKCLSYLYLIHLDTHMVLVIHLDTHMVLVTATINIFTLTVRGSILDVRI